MSSLRRILGKDAKPTWVWEESPSHFLDLSAAGLADSLPELAEWVLSTEAQQHVLDEAPVYKDAEKAPLLIPGHPGKILCLGKNFAAHAREFGAEPPSELVWFAKLPSVCVGPEEEVILPSWLDTRVDPEAEFVLLIGKELRNASPELAQTAIAAWCLGNDITARKQQGLDRERQWPWLRCKNIQTFGSYGPWWTPATSFSPGSELTIRGSIGGKLCQEGKFSDLLWGPAQALSELSRWVTLQPGDMLFLGTPAGVSPMSDGQAIEVEAEGLGLLRNTVRKE